MWECRGDCPLAAKAHPPPPARAAQSGAQGTHPRLKKTLKKSQKILKTPKNPKEKAAKGLSEEGEGQRSCQTVASPAGHCGGSARVARTGGDTMETFRLAAHMRQAGQKGAYCWLLQEGFAACCCCVLCLQLPVWKCFFPLTSTHQPGAVRCRFPNIWHIHQGHPGGYI